MKIVEKKPNKRKTPVEKGLDWIDQLRGDDIEFILAYEQLIKFIRRYAEKDETYLSSIGTTEDELKELWIKHSVASVKERFRRINNNVENEGQLTLEIIRIRKDMENSEISIWAIRHIENTIQKIA